jgi:hypothetical protein
MKIVKLSGSQTTTLANLGVDVTADILIPFDKGAGSYSFCTYCYHQGFTHIDQEVVKVCNNEAVDTGLATSQCLLMNKPRVEVTPECSECGADYDITEDSVVCRRCDHIATERSTDVPEDDLDRSFLVTGDGGNVTASKDVQGTIEKSTFHTQDSEGD